MELQAKHEDSTASFPDSQTGKGSSRNDVKETLKVQNLMEHFRHVSSDAFTRDVLFGESFVRVLFWTPDTCNSGLSTLYSLTQKFLHDTTNFVHSSFSYFGYHVMPRRARSLFMSWRWDHILLLKFARIFLSVVFLNKQEYFAKTTTKVDLRIASDRNFS